MNGYGWGYDVSYLAWIAPGIVLSLLASLYVRTTFTRWSKVPLSRGLSGARVAAELLKRAGVFDVTIERASGFLSDHFDPTDLVLRLSPAVYDESSVAAAGVAAHEAGHAIQHHVGYLPMQLRQRLIIPARIGSQLAYFIILAGILLNLIGVAWLGVGLFGAVLAFEVVTIRGELNASSRVGQLLADAGLISPPQSQGVRAVLTAAAFTYIAAMLTTLLTLLYFITQLRRRDD